MCSALFLMRQSRCGGDLEIPQEGADVEGVALSARRDFAAYLVLRDVGGCASHVGSGGLTLALE